MTFEQTGGHYVPYRGLIVEYRYRELWYVRRLSFSRWKCFSYVIRVIRPSVPNTSVPLVSRSRSLQDFARCLGYVTPEVLNQVVRLGCRFVVNMVELLAHITNHSWYDGILIFGIYHLRTLMRIHDVQGR
jgi:hypothetical protein